MVSCSREKKQMMLVILGKDEMMVIVRKTEGEMR